MKIFIILSLLLLKELSCESLSAPNPDRNEFHRELMVENVKLHKIIADLRTEITILKVDLHEIRIKKLTDEVKPFNSLADKQLDNYTTKNEIIANTTDEKSVCECQPTKLFGLKFVDNTMYEKVCNVNKSNGEWTVIQRRMDGTTNFYRPWTEYKQGFGTMSGEFFIGLDSLHLLTTCAPQELRVDMEDFNNQKRHAIYNLFEIADESDKYALKELGEYDGDAGDSLRYHKSGLFSTFDQDNDNMPAKNCAQARKGAWWYKTCHDSNLNGEYGNNEFGKGIIWDRFRGDEYSLKKVEIKIRPKYE